MWNWLMVRPERLVVTIFAGVFAVVVCGFIYLESRPLRTLSDEELEAFRRAGWEPYTPEMYWQERCELQRSPESQC